MGENKIVCISITRRKWTAFLHCLLLVLAMSQVTMAQDELVITTGPVVDDRGRPIEGTEFKVIPGRQEVAFSASTGQLTITWNPRSGRGKDLLHYVIARHKARNLALALPIEQDTQTLRLALRPAVSLSGRVVDTEGNAISGVRLFVYLYASNWVSTVDSQIQTDGRGDFTFDALPMENRYRLTVSVEGYGQKDIFFDTGEAANGRLDMGRIELPLANMSVSGRVVNMNGHPVPGIDVYCSGEDQPKCRTKSNEQGYFTLDGVCAGLVRIFAEGRVNADDIACQMLTEAGARDVRIVVREGGLGRSYYVRTKSHEDIINSGNPFIAGRVVNEEGMAVPDVLVNARCIQKKNEQGQDTESYFDVTKFGDVTDEHGHFAIELQEKATYSLLFSPNQYPAVIAYDLVADTKDLKVILPKGGTVMGQVVRFSRGEKVPIPDIKVELKQTSRTSYSHIGFDRDRKTTTDTEGRFRFDHIRTLMRTDRQEPVFGPRIWELSYGDTSQTIKFLSGKTVKHLDLVIRPDLKEAASLVGKPLPDYTGIDLDLNQDRFRDKRLLICFFDYEQRPARRCVLQLNERYRQLQRQGVEIVAVQVSKTSEDDMAQWVKTTNISVPVATVAGDLDETRFIWNVQSLPWLILTDQEQVVAAEGFGLSDLDTKIEEIAPSADAPGDSNKVVVRPGFE
jgi:hypothetical protein